MVNAKTIKTYRWIIPAIKTLRVSAIGVVPLEGFFRGLKGR